MVVLQGSGNATVTGIDFFVTEEYGLQLYESCKDVKFGAANTRAMDFIGGGAKNVEGGKRLCTLNEAIYMRCPH